MSRFGEPKPVERIKVLPQKTIKKVASKHRVFHNMCFWENQNLQEASIHAGLRNSTVSPKAIVENKNVLKIIFGKAFWEESVFGRM